MPVKPGIIAFWHGMMLPAWYYFRKDDPFAIVSLSKDGEILSYLLNKWGFKLIRGSSSKEGSKVLANMKDPLENSFLLITPDGPRGPERNFKAGAVVASSRYKKPLYLCGIKVKFYKRFTKSWDKFILPLPFSKIEMTLIKTENPPSDSDKIAINAYIANCEKKLSEISMK